MARSEDFSVGAESVADVAGEQASGFFEMRHGVNEKAEEQTASFVFREPDGMAIQAVEILEVVEPIGHVESEVPAVLVVRWAPRFMEVVKGFVENPQ